MVSERVISWAKNRFSTEGMTDKNRFTDELTEEEGTTLVEKATSRSHLEERF